MNPVDAPPAGARPNGTHIPQLQRLSWVLLVAAMSAYFCLSAHALLLLGIPYDVPQGSFPSKIHPGTYLMLLAWLAGLAAQGNPLATLSRQVQQQPLVFGSVLCMAAVFAWAAWRHGSSGLAFIIDTLVLAGVGVLAVLLQTRARQRQLLMLLMALLIANAVLAILESAFKARLIPLFPVVVESHFRSSALLGHPLTNSLVMMTMLPAVLLLPWRPAARVAAILLVLVALMTFGSRTTLGGLAVYALLVLVAVALRLLRGGFTYAQLTGGLVGVVVGLAVVVALVAATGIADRIFQNPLWDDSAAVRAKVWNVLDHVHGEDLWFGVGISRIDRIAELIGLDPQFEAIENFWLYLLLLLGIAGFTPFVLGLALLVLHMVRLADWPVRASIAMYFLFASASNTLSSKSMTLVLLAVMVQCTAALRTTGAGSGGSRRQAPDAPWTARPPAGRPPAARGGVARPASPTLQRGLYHGRRVTAAARALAAGLGRWRRRAVTA
jgi:hypothetical protein